MLVTANLQLTGDTPKAKTWSAAKLTKYSTNEAILAHNSTTHACNNDSHERFKFSGVCKKENNSLLTILYIKMTTHSLTYTITCYFLNPTLKESDKNEVKHNVLIKSLTTLEQNVLKKEISFYIEK